MRYSLLLLLLIGCTPSPPPKQQTVSVPWVITEVRAPEKIEVVQPKPKDDILELVKIEYTPKKPDLPLPQERVERPSTPPAPSYTPQRYQRRGIFRFRRGG